MIYMEITRRNRQTKTLITTYFDGDSWFTICEDHGTAAQHPNKTTAVAWSAEPKVWCETCGASE